MCACRERDARARGPRGVSLQDCGQRRSLARKEEGLHFAQGRRVGVWRAELYFLAVSGLFHNLVKRRATLSVHSSARRRLRGWRNMVEPKVGRKLVVPNSFVERAIGTDWGGISQPEAPARTLLSVLVCAVASEVDVPGAFWCRMA